MVSGEGTAWFDDFELFVDGKKFFDLEPRLTEPTLQELTWLKKYIYPLNTVDPDAPDHKDLAVLGGLVGSAQVVALEKLRTVRVEIFKLKHRIIRFLQRIRISMGSQQKLICRNSYGQISTWSTGKETL